MLRYRIDFLGDTGDVFATHELNYADDQAAISGGHKINGSFTIGTCFKIWRNGELIHSHVNAPSSSRVVPIKSGQHLSSPRAESSASRAARTRRATIWWLAASAIWIAGYLYGESLDGEMFQELGEVIPVTILPPLLLAITLWGVLRERQIANRPTAP